MDPQQRKQLQEATANFQMLYMQMEYKLLILVQLVGIMQMLKIGNVILKYYFRNYCDLWWKLSITN